MVEGHDQATIWCKHARQVFSAYEIKVKPHCTYMAGAGECTNGHAALYLTLSAWIAQFSASQRAFSKGAECSSFVSSNSFAAVKQRNLQIPLSSANHLFLRILCIADRTEPLTHSGTTTGCAVRKSFAESCQAHWRFFSKLTYLFDLREFRQVPSTSLTPL
jgi:hypothetical protein